MTWKHKATKAKDEAPPIKFGEPLPVLPLVERLRQAKVDAEAYLDEQAEAMHITDPLVPVSVIRLSLLRRQHPLEAALRLLEGE